MHNGISPVPWWFRVCGDLPPPYNCSPEDCGIPENLLSGEGVHYPQHVVESENAYKRHVYDTLRVFKGKKAVSRGLRIMNIFASINWHLMLVNLSQAVVPDAVRSMWYMVVHDLLHTNVKLHSIHIITIDSCLKFGATYTLIHRLTEYGATVDIWTWTTRGYLWSIARHLDGFLRNGSSVPQSKSVRAKTPNDCMVLMLHCILCGKNCYVTLSTWMYGLYETTRWQVYQSSTRLNTFGIPKHLLSYVWPKGCRCGVYKLCKLGPP